MPEDPNGPVAEQLASDPMLRESGFERQYRNHPRWSSRVHGSNTPGIRRTRSVANPSIAEGDVQGWPFGRALMSNVKHHEAVIAEVSTQLSRCGASSERHLDEPTLLAVHLYGSAVDGGLKPHSDIDLLVTVTRKA